MHKLRLYNCIGIFLTIWSIWSIWDAIEPFISIYKLAALFLFLPISALLLAISFLTKDGDDDDFTGGIMMPIMIGNKI